MKKIKLITFITIIALIAVLFTSCSSTGKIRGRWAASFKMSFNTSLLDPQEFPFVENTTCNYNLVFNEDDTYALSRSVPAEQRSVAIEGYKKIFLSLYQDEHNTTDIAKLMEQLNCETEDALVEKLLLSAAQASGFSRSDDYICDRLGISTTVLASGTYDVSGKEISFFNTDGSASKLSATLENDSIILTNGERTITFYPVGLD